MEQDFSKAKLPRRLFLRDTIALATVASLSPSLLLGCQSAPATSATLSANADTMDEALEMMAKLGPLTNHGPMAAEALVALDRRDAVINFVQAYKRRFSRSYPLPRATVTKENWRDALSDNSRNADWAAFFNRELNEQSWQKVLGDWSEKLAPGLAAAAAHGLLRTAHATRSLAVRETPLRRRELAEGLGYWAAYYQPLPETAGDNSSQLKPAEAISKIPLLPQELRARGSIMAGLQSLTSFKPFAPVANLVNPAGRPEAVLSELTETFATVYVKGASPRTFVTLLHAVTGLTAIRSLLPYVSAPTTLRLLHYGWQMSAGLYSIAETVTNQPSQEKEIKPADLIARAVEINEEHAIKLTEACLREHALNPKPIYLEAAHDILGRIAPV
jgi:hypothetical protein